MEVAAEMGLGGNSAGGMQNMNQMMYQNLQALIAANPAFLTGGIPTKLLSQMWVDPSKMMQTFAVRKMKNFV